jgi:peptidoglycan L-alanyl-D-glutamate endopeptidase CwlK
MYKLGRKSKKHLIGIHPILAFAVYEAIKITKQDFTILSTGGVRTDRQQLDMYALGRTREGRKITWTRNSFHQYGLAVDLVAYHNGKPSWEPSLYKDIVKAMKKVIKKYNLPIDHGYDLWKRDLPHWQITRLDERDARKVYDIRKIAR